MPNESRMIAQRQSINSAFSDYDFAPHRGPLVPPPKSDAVTHPSHYTRFVIEPMTFATANGLSGLELNVVKYALRAPFKNGLEDYDKAIRCLEMLKETFKRKARVAAGEKASDVWSVVL